MSACNTNCGCHLKPWALGLAIGVIWGLCIFIMGLLVSFAVVDTAVITNSGMYFFKFGPTLLGSVIAGLVGFVHGFIKGALIAWLYNIFSHCCRNCCKTPGKIDVEIEK